MPASANRAATPVNNKSALTQSGSNVCVPLAAYASTALTHRSGPGSTMTTVRTDKLEPLLEFLEEERVLNPAYSMQYRRALTLPDKLEQLRAVLDSLPLTSGEVESVVARVTQLLPTKGGTLTCVVSCCARVC